MPTLAHLTAHVRTYGRSHRAFLALCAVLFFWTVFDGIVTYVTPLLVTQAGFNEGTLGLIIGSSSVFGAAFDLLMVRIVRRATYRWYFLGMFAVSAAMPLALAQASSVSLFLVAMAIWALFFNLQTLGKLDFTARRRPQKEHASSFGVYDVFQAAGYIVAPLLVGLVVGEHVGLTPFWLMWLFLGIAGLGYVAFLGADRQSPLAEPSPTRSRRLFAELRLWRRLGRRLAAPLLLVIFLDMVTSLFWTIGPIFTDQTTPLGELNALIVAAYEFPILLVGWFVGGLVARYRAQPVAYATALLGSIGLIGIGFLPSPALLVGVTLLAGAAFAVSLPTINGLFADVVEDGHGLEPEIESLEDFGTNLGYVVGPILAGAVAQLAGPPAAFITIGAIGLILSLGLLTTLRRTISPART